MARSQLWLRKREIGDEPWCWGSDKWQASVAVSATARLEEQQELTDTLSPPPLPNLDAMGAVALVNGDAHWLVVDLVSDLSLTRDEQIESL